ncbi:hypothetical protein [Pseudomonas sp.]|uniref:hypothetical protein n=1 Tax=Pseudomonas sp. TaxID=306 RepID=UPI003D0F085B
MSKQVINRWMPTDLAELREALTEIVDEVASLGGDISSTYVELRDVALVRETLSDGSTAFNIVVRENR